MTYQLVVLLIIAGVLIIGYWVFSNIFSRGHARSELGTDYTRALEALVRSDKESARKFLIESARKNPSSLNPFLVLGDLFREQGDPQRAEKIHHELSIRPKLGKEDTCKIYRSLIQDYLEQDKFGQAVLAAGKLLSMAKKDPFALNSLLKAYEGSGDWDKAIDTAGTIASLPGADRARFVSRYHAYVGWRLMGSDSESAGNHFEKALSLDPDCLPACIYMGDIYLKECQYDKAIKLWDGMLDRNPKAVHHLEDRLEKAYFESGQYSKMMEVYERLHRRIPSDILVLLGLARMSLKKGDIPGATRYVDEAREIEPRDHRIYKTYLDIHEESGEPEPALEACRGFFNKVFSDEKRYSCPACAYQTAKILVRCPECGNWGFELEG